MASFIKESPYHSCEESECLEVLEYVGSLGGDEEHVEFLQWLVDVTYALRLHEGVLFARVHQFGEGGQEPLDTRPSHLHELT